MRESVLILVRSASLITSVMVQRDLVEAAAGIPHTLTQLSN